MSDWLSGGSTRQGSGFREGHTADDLALKSGQGQGSLSVQSDLSSGAVPIGDTYRGFGSSWFNQANIEREDWFRDQQSQELAFGRDLDYLARQNEFNASEAQKSRDWQEKMSNTAYQRAIADMKLAGINPVLAYQQGGADWSSGAVASSGGSRSSSGYRRGSSFDPLNGVFGSVLKVIAGALTHNPGLVVSGITDTMIYDRNGVQARQRNFQYSKNKI